MFSGGYQCTPLPSPNGIGGFNTVASATGYILWVVSSVGWINLLGVRGSIVGWFWGLETMAGVLFSPRCSFVYGVICAYLNFLRGFAPLQKPNRDTLFFFAHRSFGVHTFLHALPTLSVNTPSATAWPTAGTIPPSEGIFDESHCVACSLRSAKTTVIPICRSNRRVPKVAGRNP